MKRLPPVRLYLEGDTWFAEMGERTASGGTARDAVGKVLTLLGKEPRTCRKCGRTWECKRTRTVRICPQCQTGKGAPTL